MLKIASDNELALYYLEDLYAEVLAAARAGQSLDQMIAGITLESYKDWSQYEAWRPGGG